MIVALRSQYYYRIRKLFGTSTAIRTCQASKLGAIQKRLEDRVLITPLHHDAPGRLSLATPASDAE